MNRAAMLVVLLSASAASAQNIVEGTPLGGVSEPARLADADVAALVARAPALTRGEWDAETRRAAARLDAHVAELAAGHPWRPLHVTLGISGYSAEFGHPDELFLALSLALPYLSEPTAARTRELLAGLLKTHPPYRTEGFDPSAGRGREPYDVPETVRPKAPAKARSTLGVYALWAYCHWSGDTAAAKSHWPAVRDRMRPLLERDYIFDIDRVRKKDEAETLTGDAAGLIGLVRLARLNGDADTEAKARVRLRQVLELRVNLDRVHRTILEPTESTTARLHVFKVARHCGLVPEVGEALARHCDGRSAERLRLFRGARPVWWMAYGERLIGGENYTNPPHLARSLFAGAALVEKRSAGELVSWLDVPWGKADPYFVEKSALALWAASGRGWTVALMPE